MILNTLLVASVLSMLSFGSSDPGITTFLSIQGQRVTVSGQTSVGGFRCTLEKETEATKIALQGSSGSGAALLYLTLPVKAFSCGNFLLNRDFQKTLKMEQHPHIRVEVLRLQANGAHFIGKLDLTVAGTKKKLDNIQFRYQTYKKSKVLRSQLTLKMSEFGLTPPSRFGGLVRVEEELVIEVDLVL